jgi:hypothetical protein
MATKKPKKPSISKLKIKLDAVYSKYIRLKYSKFGMVRCVTCGKQSHWKDMQNGHFVSRKETILRWDDRNCHPQCCACNVFMHGNMANYAEWMLKTYGQDIISQLNKEKQEIFKLNTNWLGEQINIYTNKIKEYE